MAIIKLTDFANEKTKYYINTRNIDGLCAENERDAITDVCTVGHCFRVKETPEEILALIKEAKNGNRKEILKHNRRNIGCFSGWENNS